MQCQLEVGAVILRKSRVNLPVFTQSTVRQTADSLFTQSTVRQTADSLFSLYRHDTDAARKAMSK